MSEEMSYDDLRAGLAEFGVKTGDVTDLLTRTPGERPFSAGASMPQAQRLLALLRAVRADAIAALGPPQGEDEGWRPMETAPKDGTPILAWTVHANAKYSDDPVSDGWAGVSLIRWIDHNGGGWTWHGLAGEHVAWQPVPAGLSPPPPPPRRRRPCLRPNLWAAIWWSGCGRRRCWSAAIITAKS